MHACVCNDKWAGGQAGIHTHTHTHKTIYIYIYIYIYNFELKPLGKCFYLFISVAMR